MFRTEGVGHIYAPEKAEVWFGRGNPFYLLLPGTFRFRAGGGVSDMRPAMSRIINFSQASPAIVHIPVMVIVSGFFGSFFIRGN